MSNIYDDDIVTALELIEEAGESCIWRRIVNDPDTSEPWKSQEPDILDNEVSIVFLPRKRVDMQLIRATDQSIPIGSVYGLMGAQDFPPAARDVVLRNGIEIRINAIDILAPNGEPILYTIDFSL